VKVILVSEVSVLFIQCLAKTLLFAGESRLEEVFLKSTHKLTRHIESEVKELRADEQ